MADNTVVDNVKAAVAVEENGSVPFYEYVLFACGGELRARKIETMQVNIGLKCNQTCSHCHVDASPVRTECMSPELMQEVIDVAERTHCRLVEITGGAPELHKEFRWFISALRKKEIPVRLRTNLTVLLEKGLEDIPDMLRDHCVEIVASLPWYLEETVQAQRGKGAFQKSIRVIKRLNKLGYGIEPGLTLDLVYNPSGPFLPADQDVLEETYRNELSERYGINFTHLLAVTNMPIGRFAEQLEKDGQTEEYLTLLRNSFNPQTVDKVMCRNQITVNWDGAIYDCDFNLALGLPVVSRNQVENLDNAVVVGRAIRTGDHCFGCTAAAGSSCRGALVMSQGEAS